CGLVLILQALLQPAHGYAWMAKIKAPSLMNLRKMQKGSKFGDKKIVVITGTSSGLGKAATKALLRAGDYHVVGAVRDLEKMKIVAELEGFDMDRFTPMYLDLASFESVHNFAKDLDKFRGDRPVDRLVCNAAVYQPTLSYPKWTVDGHEQQLQINYLSQFLLTSKVMPMMTESDDARVCMIGSVTGNDNTVGGGGVYPIADLKELDGLELGCQKPIAMMDGYNFNGAKMYKDTKLALMMTSNMLHERFHRSTGISFSSIYPGCIAESPLFREKRPWFRKYFPIFMKYITGGYVGEEEAGTRLFQVLHDPKCTKSGVYWSWNGGPREGRGVEAMEKGGQIVGAGGAGGGWESIYENDQSDKVHNKDMMLKLWQCTNEITGAEWPKAYQAKSPCPTLKVVGAATQILGIMEERARMKASRDGEGAKIVGNRTLPKEVVFQPQNVMTMARAGQPLSEVASQADVFIRYKCKKGKCKTCSVNINGKWVCACQTKIPPQAAGERFEVKVRPVSDDHKTQEKAAFFTPKSFADGVVNNGLGVVGFVKEAFGADPDFKARMEREKLVEEMLAKARRSSTSSTSVGPSPSSLRGTPHGSGQIHEIREVAPREVDADSREGRSQFAVAGVAATAAFVLALIHHFQGFRMDSQPAGEDLGEDLTHLTFFQCDDLVGADGSNGDGSRASAAKQAAAPLNPILPTQSWFEDTIVQFEREQITEEQFDLVHGSFLMEAWLGEFNMSTECPEPIEIITDAEEAVSSFMKGAINHRPASFVKAPPQGHQTIGGAEAGVRAIKDAFNTLRQDLRENGCDVCVRNQTAVNVPASLKKDCISRFEKATYLRPEFNSLGDVVCTVIGGQERFFVCKSFKIVSPLEWDVSLSPSVLHFFDRMQLDVSIEDLSAKMSVRRLSGKQKPPPGLGEADEPIQQRFPDFPANREKRVSFDLPKNQPIPESLPVEGGQHLDENPHDVPYSPSLAPSSPKALDEPEIIHDMEVDDSADGMVDLSEFAAAGGEPTATEAMELDLVTALDNFELSYLEERHIGMLQSVYQIRGVKPKSSKANLCGEEILLLFPGYVISDANGQYLDKDLAYAGMRTEIDSMTSQKVGRPIHEQEAQRLAKQWQISIITCRWVCVEKDPLNVRMRLVAREMAKGKSSARDLMVSSPTSSIESLRILIAEAAVLDLVILGLDISAAFMASPLGHKWLENKRFGLGRTLKYLQLPFKTIWPYT
ncbi:unnamed protein product, partial [Cladocopium goreaui]